jgi:hypothetical protein
MLTYADVSRYLQISSVRAPAPPAPDALGSLQAVFASVVSSSNGCEVSSPSHPLPDALESLQAVFASVVSSSSECGNGCEGEDTLATHWCASCRKALCSFCVSAHGRIPALRPHTLSKIEQQCGNGCEGEDTLATHWCASCQAALCPFCVKAHTRMPAMQSHRLSKIARSASPPRY